MPTGRLVTVASGLGAGARAGIVTALMDGTAHTSTELARHLGIAPSAISEHLGVLLDVRLVVVEVQGRHRYFRLAGADVAALVESMVAAAPPVVGRPRAARLTRAGRARTVDLGQARPTTYRPERTLDG